MICNECQYDITEHRLYGCNAGAEEEAEKAAIYDEAWLALPAWVTDACEPDHCGDLPHAIGLLAEKARLFGILADRITSGAWRVERWEPVIGEVRQGARITLTRAGKRVHGATLVEAVTKAMEAEGKR